MKARNETIDAIKGFAILLVVIGHICTEWSNLVQWIFSFHMPLFFMISGYIDEMNYQHDDIPIKKYVSKKLCTLLWPYYVWAILVTGATAYIAFKSGNVALLIKTFVSRMLGYEIADNTIGSIWFLLSLFEAEVCCFVLKKIRHEEIVCIVWGMGVLLYLAFPELNLLFLFQLFWIAVTFVQIGHWIYRYKIVTFLIDKVTRMKNRKWGSIFVIMLLLFSIVILLDGTFSNQKVNVVFQELGSVYLFWSVSIGWSILFFVLFEWIGLRYHFKIINKVGKETLVIMATHYYVNAFLYKLFINFEYMHYLVAMLLYCIALIGVCYIFARIIRKYIPFLVRLNIKFGKKREKII